MAMNIDSLDRTLRRAFGSKLKYEVQREAETIKMRWRGAENYRNPEGEDSLLLLVLLTAQGEYLEVRAPRLYDSSKCQHMGALCRVLLGTSWRTPLVQFSLDESDGEVSASAEMVLMDGKCTTKQLETTIRIVRDEIDKFHPQIHEAMQSGTISFPGEGTVTRPSLDDSESETSPLDAIDIDEALRESLKESRVAGRKLWESAAVPRDVGRQAD